ncbi:MAG: hypothetical protein MUE36_10695 [Acidimicrobiales bacterium]|jgi:hypothetical protein|nr:hypothetical protein [Acidimicrobiales bacterium]
MTDPSAEVVHDDVGPRRIGGCLASILVVGALAVFTVLVVVSLTLAGVIGGEGSASEQAERLAEIEAEYGIATSSQDLDHPPQRDLRLGRCERDAAGRIVSMGSVTNYTSEPVNYVISATFLAGSGTDVGEELAATTVRVDDVAAERTVDWTAESGVVAPGDFTCRVVRIERTP